MQTKLTQWHKLGDHSLVKEITNQEYDYQESKYYGAAVIYDRVLIFPGQYIVEVNDIFVGVISEENGNKILSQEALGN